MGKDLKSRQGLGFQGFVQIELENKETGGKRVFRYNTITKLGKMLFLASGPALQLMQPSQIDRGMLYIDSMFTIKSSSNTDYLEVPSIDRGIHLYLANDSSTLTEDSKFLPLYTPNGEIDPDKLVGFAGFRRVPSSPKEGVIDRVKDDFMTDAFAVVQRWKFDYTQANGTFNKLCIGAGVHSSPGNGFALSKGLNPTDIPDFGGIGSLKPFYMRPGVTGYTSDTEILLSVGSGDTADAVYDFSTGKLTLLSQDDTRYGAPLGDSYAQQIFYNGMLYYIYNRRLYRFNTATKDNTLIDSCYYGAMWEEGNLLYYYDNDGSSTTVRSYNMDTLSSGSSFDIKSGQTFTSKWFRDTTYPLRECTIGRLSDGNYLILPRGSSYGPYYNIVCTDIRNIEATIVGYRPRVKSVSEYIINGKPVNIWANVTHDFRYTRIVSEYSALNNNRDINGLKFSENWFGNLISFVELPSPITKTDTDVLYISYGYRIV